jgi:hypothetical protein
MRLVPQLTAIISTRARAEVGQCLSKCLRIHLITPAFDILVRTDIYYPQRRELRYLMIYRARNME